jgi:hypothetical protein
MSTHSHEGSGILGTAGERPVHWLLDECDIDSVEEIFRNNKVSRLKQLFILKQCTREGLSDGENEEIMRLIFESSETFDSCWICNHQSNTVSDVGMCRMCIIISISS